MAAGQRKVRVIALGGTIAMAASSGALTPALGAADLAAMTGPEGLLLEVDWTDFLGVPSANITFADLVRLAAVIEQLHGEGYHGVVVAQGTDSLEETAFALDLLVTAPIDIVLTGAMRGSSAVGADGATNLLGALRFLEASSGQGEVVIVMDDCVHAARLAVKGHTTALAAFTSGECGLRGRIHEGRFVAFNPARTGLPKIAADTGRTAPAVELVTIALEHSPWALRAPGHEAVEGWVIAAMGAGHVPETLVPDLERLARTAPVVLCSRTGAGPVCTATYGYPGAEIDLLGRGLLHGGSLSPLKARVLLTLLLMEGPDDCRARFSRIAEAI
ncbi:asparaginase [Novosphingobium sp.]|uniref:asparaginase n=1 Tax=Novosphingobium sp. TaxID=1874826 RepID=UPI0035B40183